MEKEILPNNLVFFKDDLTMAAAADFRVSIIQTPAAEDMRGEVVERLENETDRSGKIIKYVYLGDGRNVIAGLTAEELKESLKGLDYKIIQSL